jgi:hypothetical protein
VERHVLVEETEKLSHWHASATKIRADVDLNIILFKVFIFTLSWLEPLSVIV